MKKFFSVALLFTSMCFAQDQIIQKGNVEYLANKLIVKFKQSQRTSVYKGAQIPQAATKSFQQIGVQSIEKSAQNLKIESEYYSDLDRTFILEYSSPYDPEIAAKKISSSPEIEWAEPWYVYKICLEPNDPKFTDGTQWYLNIISAQQAWDLSTGNEEIVIAINDTGVDWDHPDLANNIWINEDEIPGNGIDDDGNGYVDDIRGWDFGGTDGTPDNDPVEDTPTHGTWVAGLASAVTNNSTGVASVGYNCKIMPVKTAQLDQKDNIVYGREGIIYAANNGADVINCSWGIYSYSRAMQEAVYYAVSLGSVVVGAAGNNKVSNLFYPASYDGVISVGGSNPEDGIYSDIGYGTNYGTAIDVLAPATGDPGGNGMYGLWQDDTYIPGGSGTSLAAPIVAGLAGLVIDKFPDYSPLQVAEQIRVNADDIYDNVSSTYQYLLGKGRINAYKALNNTAAVSIRAVDFKYTDLSNGNGIIEPGETFALGVNFVNYLNPVNAVQVTLESRSEYVSISQNSFTITSAGTLEEVNNYNAPFEFTASEDIPQNEAVEFLLKFNSGIYNDFQFFIEKANTTFLTQSGNDITISIGNEGTLGFVDLSGSSLSGDGLYFMNGDNLLYEGALIYGNSSEMVMDAAHIDNTNMSQDFNSINPFSIKVPGEYADYEGYTKFNDNGASPNLGIETELYTYSFTQEEYSSFIILRYKFLNTADTVVNNFHAGLFFDFDMNIFLNDFTKWDDVGKFGYVIDADSNDASRIDDKIAVALISDTKYEYRAFSNNYLDNPISPYGDGFTEREKWYAIASAITIPEKGPEDIALGVSGGPYTIQPHDSLNVAFAIAGGYSLEELRTAIQNSREAYGLIPTSVRQINNELSLEFSLSQNSEVKRGTSNVKLIVYDILGREIKTLLNKPIQPGEYEIEFDGSELPSGVYFYKLSAGSFVETKKMMIIK
jgi:subtilisin family serine protease